MLRSVSGPPGSPADPLNALQVRLRPLRRAPAVPLRLDELLQAEPAPDWRIETVNVTGKDVLKKRLLSTCADLVMVQEHGVTEGPAMDDFCEWARIRRWTVVATPAALSDAGKPRSAML